MREIAKERERVPERKEVERVRGSKSPLLFLDQANEEEASTTNSP